MGGKDIREAEERYILSYIKADTPKEQEYFDYLEELRQSGTTNMWGAAPYLRKAFPKDFPKNKGFTDGPCGEVVAKWIKLHSDPKRIMERA